MAFKTKCQLSTFVNCVNGLSGDQRNAIKKIGFGCILVTQNQSLNKNMLVELMERWSSEKHAFVLPPGEIKITLLDVAVIFGLRVTGEAVVLKEDDPLSDLEKEYGATMEKRHVAVSFLEKKLRSFDKTASEDFIRSFLLYTFGTFLFPNASGTIDSRYLSLLEVLDKVPKFAWGKALLEDTIEWLDKRNRDMNMEYMGSCLIFLQMWSYEHIDIALPSSRKCYLTFPRASRWKNSSRRPRQWFTTKFEELRDDQIIWKLQLTSEESTSDIIIDLLEIQNDVVEVVSKSECSVSISHCSCTSHTPADDDDIRDRDEPSKQVIELEDSKSDEVASTSECSVSISHCSFTSPTPADDDDIRDRVEPSKQVIELEDSESHTVNKISETEQSNMELLSCRQSTPVSVTELENSESDIINKLPETEQDNTELLPCRQCSCVNHTPDSEHYLRSQRRLEEQIVELKKEVDDLRTENKNLRDKLLSSDTLIDRMERILLDEDADEKEA